MKNREVIFYERVEKLMAIIAQTLTMNSNISNGFKENVLEAIESIMEDN